MQSRRPAAGGNCGSREEEGGNGEGRGRGKEGEIERREERKRGGMSGADGS